MSIFAISDPHLSFDPRVEKPMDIFGGEWVGHTEKLNTSWRETVKDNDTVIVAGDISWGLRLDEALADLNWIHDLPGKKILFKGNHDLWWSSNKKLNALYDDMTFIQNGGCYMVDEDTYIAGTRGWITPGTDGFTEHDEKMYKRELLRLRMSIDEAKENGAKRIIGVLHYPPCDIKRGFSGFTDIFEEYGIKNVVYGHLHGESAHRTRIEGEIRGVNYNLISVDYTKGKLIEIK